MDCHTDSAVLFVGDTHGNVEFLIQAVLPTAIALEVSTIVQLGDFGFAPWSGRFIEEAASAKARYGIEVWFIDGNHEHHTVLATEATYQSGEDHPRHPIHMVGGLYYLPRGARCVVAGHTAVAVGGAVSIDRGLRTPGVDWFIEEQINDDDLAAIAAGGHAEIMLSHDAPSGWDIPGLLGDADIPLAWLPHRPAAEDHRHRVREAFEAVKPTALLHGHYHLPYMLTQTESWGDVEVVGLDCDEGQYWGALLRPGNAPGTNSPHIAMVG